MRTAGRVATTAVGLGVVAAMFVTMSGHLRSGEGEAEVVAGAVPATIAPLPPATTMAPPANVPPVGPPIAEIEDPLDQTLAPPPDIKPLRVRIPGIDVDAEMIDLGKDGNGKLEVPSDFGLTGWYTGRSVPGEFGPSVVVGHVDSKAGPAVFFHLRDLERGDIVQIDRSDGLVAYFRVTETILVDKDEFPTDLVYGSTDAPELRLVTCGGTFNRDAGSYLGNVIVFAEHLGNFAAPSRAV